MKPFRYLFVILLAGCMSNFSQPYPESDIENLDENLIGIWEGEFMGNKTYLHIHKSMKDKQYVDIIYILHDQLSGSLVSQTKGYPFSISGNSFFNLTDGNSNIIIKYSLPKNDLLTVSFVHEKSAKQAIQGNIINGIVDSDNVTITSTGNTLDSFLKKDNIYASLSKKITDGEFDDYFIKVRNIVPSMKLPQ